MYTKEITKASTDAVAATNQTYVDALKNAHAFNKEAQADAAEMAMAACTASISSAAMKFILEVYGDVDSYLVTRLEAEVRKQKNNAPILLGQAVEAE